MRYASPQMSHLDWYAGGGARDERRVEVRGERKSMKREEARSVERKTATIEVREGSA